MMKKTIVLLALLAGAWAIPAVRAKIVGVAEPALEKLGPVGDKIIKPAQRYSARTQAKTLMRFIITDLTEGKPLPDQRRFHEWVVKRTGSREEAIDPWGNRYWFTRVSRTLSVGSDGPDGEHGTSDDVVHNSPF